MTNQPALASDFAPEPATVCVVRWVLSTGRASVACEVEMNPDASFDLRVVPSWRTGATLVERFSTAVPAIKKHAQVAGALRDLGWTVTDRATFRGSIPTA